MKKILLFILLFLAYVSNSYAYIDYRHDIKTDYYSSEIFMNKNLDEKEKINKKTNLIFEKVKNLKFDDKIDYIESIKEKILSFLFSNHIQKDSVIYYRLVYFYNQLDSIKYKTDYNYQTTNYTSIYNNKYYNFNNNKVNCTFKYNWKNYYLKNTRTKYFKKSNNTIKYKCSNWVIYKETISNNYQRNNYYNSNIVYYHYWINNRKACNLNSFWYNYIFYSWNYRTIFKEYLNKIEYRRYKCEDWKLKLVSRWYKNK